VAKFWKTAGAALELNVTYYTLFNLLRHRKMEPPARDSSGDYIWTRSDLSRARKALALLQKHPRREATGGR
jgi:hypothetical protein